MEITCAKRVCKGFEIKNLWEYHEYENIRNSIWEYHVQSDTLLLGDVFETFRKMWLKIYELDTMLLIVEKGIREGKCHSIYQYGNANNKYMKDYDKNKESPYFCTSQLFKIS